MIDKLLSELISKSGELGSATIFLLLMLVLFYYMRKDSHEHRVEYKETIKQMFSVVGKNTESNTKLSDTIGELKEEIRRK